MADIELVIKIDEEIYKRLKSLSRGDYFEHDICGNSMRRIANGTPLPKGHGDLIEPKCDRINSLASVLPYAAHREVQELLCEIMDLCKTESE